VLTAADPAALEWDLFGDDLLAERGLALAEDDRRAVGEALAHQLEFADVVVLGGEPPAGPDRTRTLLSHLVRAEPDLRAVGALRPAGLLGPRIDDDRGDPRHARPTGAPDADGVWTLDFHSWRPLHPERLLAELPTLGEGWLRARGRFWLPTRPDTVAVWDGAGGQLSVGALGTWESPPETRVVVTGLDEDPARLREAFARALLTDTELARGLHRWTGAEDGFDEWLGAEDLSA
jgi:G3E family GTPase